MVQVLNFGVMLNKFNADRLNLISWMDYKLTIYKYDIYNKTFLELEICKTEF
jgi:hypothetical protein